MITYTGGHDKMRGTGEGQIIHKGSGWQNMLITASNRSLIDQIMSTGESDAPAMRILEFPVESGSELKPSEAALMKKQMENNAGWAGDAFLTYLLEPEVLAWTKKRLHMMVDEIYAKGGFKKEHRFWVRALAATATAALIVEKLNLISFSPNRIMGWAFKHFAARVDGEQREKNAAVPTISRFLNEHIGETLVMPGPANGRMEMAPIGDKPRNRISVRVEVEGDRIFIAEPILREWLDKKAGGGYAEMVRELDRKEVLKHARKMVTLTAGSGIRGGQVWCMVLDGGHPALTGMLREARVEKRDIDRREKLRSLK
jgi:hypothetical protein